MIRVQHARTLAVQKYRCGCLELRRVTYVKCYVHILLGEAFIELTFLLDMRVGTSDMCAR